MGEIREGFVCRAGDVPLGVGRIWRVKNSLWSLWWERLPHSPSPLMDPTSPPDPTRPSWTPPISPPPPQTLLAPPIPSTPNAFEDT